MPTIDKHQWKLHQAKMYAEHHNKNLKHRIVRLRDNYEKLFNWLLEERHKNTMLGLHDGDDTNKDET